MRDRSSVLDGKNVKSVIDEGTNGRIAAAADALHYNRHILRATRLDLLRNGGDHL